jgi:DNA primase
LSTEAAQALASVPVPLPSCAAADANLEDAEAGWWHIYGLMHGRALEQELASARRDFALRADSAAQRRLIALCAARESMQSGEDGET